MKFVFSCLTVFFLLSLFLVSTDGRSSTVLRKHKLLSDAAAAAAVTIAHGNNTEEYFMALINSTFTLLNTVCAKNGSCPDFDMSGSADILLQVQAVNTDLLVTPVDNGDTTDSEAAAEDECAADSINGYNQGLHIGALFIILAVSALGTALPLLGKYISWLRLHPYVICVGKSLGIGIILACALIHMLAPGNEELTNKCLSREFTETYSAYAYLFCLLGIIFMHTMDFTVDTYVQVQLNKLKNQVEADEEHDHSHGEPTIKSLQTNEDEMNAVELQAPKDKNAKPHTVTFHTSMEEYNNHDLNQSALVDCKKDNLMEHQIINIKTKHDCMDPHAPATNGTHSSAASTAMVVKPHVHTSEVEIHEYAHHHGNKQENGHSHSHGHGHSHGHSHNHSHGSNHGHSHGPGSEGHSHSLLAIQGLQMTFDAWLLEFGVTSHSILIGITTGIVDANHLKALLVALVFHQFFEGVALGARILDADFASSYKEIFMCLMFSVSAPLGMMIGIILTSSINPNGSTYNYVSGVFDGFCAGILLYIGLNLLFTEFPADIQKYCKKVNVLVVEKTSSSSAIVDLASPSHKGVDESSIIIDAASPKSSSSAPFNSASAAAAATTTTTTTTVKKSVVDESLDMYMVMGLFVALWTGAGVMAYIGRYL